MNDFLAWAASPWGQAAVAAAMILAAIGAGLLIHATVFALLRRMARRPGHVVEASLERHGRRASRWLLPLAAILMVLPGVPLTPEFRQGLEHLVSLGLIAGGAWCVILSTAVLADLIAARHPVEVADNLSARAIRTQVQVLRRVVTVVVVILTLAAMLLTFPAARTIGASMLASAGIAGLVIGMAMRPTLANLVAGVQIALTQPIRLEDQVVVEGESGWIEEITSTYVVVRIWDLRRMVLPLTYFIEHPFQNWTRTSRRLLGTVFFYLDYTVPVAQVRSELERLVHASPLWGGHVCGLQMTDNKDRTIELRALVDAPNADALFDLRCLVREGVIGFLQQRHPLSLPRTRSETVAQAAGQGRG